VHVNRNIKIRVKKGFCCLNLGRALTNPKIERNIKSLMKRIFFFINFNQILAKSEL
jgi:hypothetical protein